MHGLLPFARSLSPGPACLLREKDHRGEVVPSRTHKDTPCPLVLLSKAVPPRRAALRWCSIACNSF